MLIRTAIAAMAVAAASTAVIAQSDPVAARRAEMKAMGSHIYGALNRMQRGQEPYDQAKVDAAIVQFVASTQKLPSLFPDGSKSGTNPGEDFRTSDKIWTDKADFNGRFEKLSKDATDAKAKVTSLDALKAAYPALRRTCDNCHETYLIKN